MQKKACRSIFCSVFILTTYKVNEEFHISAKKISIFSTQVYSRKVEKTNLFKKKGLPFDPCTDVFINAMRQKYYRSKLISLFFFKNLFNYHKCDKIL